MIYCMSDLHGELDFFQEMLKQIHFSDTDHLYILGDVIDRGTGGVDILEQIMDAPNMTMLLGNHEQMCLSTLGPCNEVGARDLWRYNGGATTYREEYCERPVAEGQQTCREAGAFQQWTKKQSDDPIFKAYRKEYKKRFAWIKAGRISDTDFYAWSEQAREMKKKCDGNAITLDEFVAWLKQS